MKMTYQPKKRQRKKEHGFRKRMKTKNGRNVLKRRRQRGRKVLSAQRPPLVVFLLLIGHQKAMLKKEVLRKKDDFDRIYRKGKSIGDRYVVLFFHKNDLPYNRTAFLASKKVGNSVQRNRAKRLMKESFRQFEDDVKVGYDYIIIARNTINGRKMGEVKESLMRAMKKGKRFL